MQAFGAARRRASAAHGVGGLRRVRPGGARAVLEFFLGATPAAKFEAAHGDLTKVRDSTLRVRAGS
jgi:hypothetical protein